MQLFRESAYLSANKGGIWLMLSHVIEAACRMLEYRQKPVYECIINAFEARLDKFWSQHAVKFDFTVDLTGTGNRSEEVISTSVFFRD